MIGLVEATPTLQEQIDERNTNIKSTTEKIEELLNNIVRLKTTYTEQITKIENNN